MGRTYPRLVDSGRAGYSISPARALMLVTVVGLIYLGLLGLRWSWAVDYGRLVAMPLVALTIALDYVWWRCRQTRGRHSR